MFFYSFCASLLYGRVRANLHDDPRVSIMKAPNPHQAPQTAAAILFEAGKHFKDLSWWVLGPEFLKDLDTWLRTMHNMDSIQMAHEQQY